MQRLAWVALVCACRLNFDASSGVGDATTVDDALEDATPPDAPPPTGPFMGVAPITEINMGGPADDVTLTGDQTEMFFNTARAPNMGGEDIWSAKQDNIGDWTVLASVTPLNTSADDATPEVSRDGLTMFFVAGGSVGAKDVFQATRVDRMSPWGNKTEITAASTASDESGPTLTPDLLTMYVSSAPSGDDDIYVSTRASIGSAWSAPALVAGINSPTANDAEPFINGTNTLLLFSSNRNGNFDLFMSRRATVTDPWGTPVAVTELNTGAAERDPWLSPDERTIYFARDTALYTAFR